MCSVLRADDALRVLALQTDRVVSVAWSPCSDYVITAQQNALLCVWCVTSGKQVVVLPAPTPTTAIRSVAWSPNGKHIAAAFENAGWVWCFDKLRATCDLACGLVGHISTVMSVAWSPCSKFLATGSFDRTARIWRFGNALSECIQVLHGHTDLITSVAWSPVVSLWDVDGIMLATSSCDGTVRVWRFDASEDVTNSACKDMSSKDSECCLKVLKMHTGREVTCVAWSPCSKYLATGSDDGTARVSRVSTGGLVCELHGHSFNVMSVAWSPCGTMLATSSYDGTARVWRFDVSKDVSKDASEDDTSKAGICIKVLLHVYSNWPRCVAWSPCSTRVVTASYSGGSYSGSAHIWMVCKWTPRTHRCFTPTARQLALRVMCARDRLASTANKTSPPLEIWLLLFEQLFS